MKKTSKDFLISFKKKSPKFESLNSGCSLFASADGNKYS